MHQLPQVCLNRTVLYLNQGHDLDCNANDLVLPEEATNTRVQIYTHAQASYTDEKAKQRQSSM